VRFANRLNNYNTLFGYFFGFSHVYFDLRYEI
jgi:hypothetical protein